MNKKDYKSMFEWECSHCRLEIEYTNKHRDKNGKYLRCECFSNEKYKVVWFWDGQYVVTKWFGEMTKEQFQKEDLMEKGFELDIFNNFKLK